jgi:hypothetical protein
MLTERGCERTNGWFCAENARNEIEAELEVNYRELDNKLETKLLNKVQSLKDKFTFIAKLPTKQMFNSQ